MWFLLCGVILVAGALLGQRLGLKTYATGRSGAKRTPDDSISGRLVTCAIGLALIWMGIDEILK